MANYKPGLHKDVEIIFNGVWNAQVDNIQQFVEPAGLSGRVGPRPLRDASRQPLVPDGLGHPLRENPTGNSPDNHVASKTLKQEWNRWFLFSPKKRRERKRLLSISRYLMFPFK